MLKEGEKAPCFELYDQSGNLYSPDGIDKRFLILFFFPRDDSVG